MTDPRCDQLDNYLCGWLSPDEAADFEAHLAECPACQEERAIQQRIDRLLAEGNDSVAPVPVGLRSRVDRGIRAARRRRAFGWAGAAAAAVSVALALGLWAAWDFSFLPQAQRNTEQSMPIDSNEPVAVAPPVHPESPPAPVVQVTMLDPDSAIVMPIESRSPNVTLVRIYPTFRINQEGEDPEPP
jgi:anti-sigma factor RsiW